jgi:hypothetical protein
MIYDTKVVHCATKGCNATVIAAHKHKFGWQQAGTNKHYCPVCAKKIAKTAQ